MGRSQHEGLSKCVRGQNVQSVESRKHSWQVVVSDGQAVRTDRGKAENSHCLTPCKKRSETPLDMKAGSRLCVSTS